MHSCHCLKFFNNLLTELSHFEFFPGPANCVASAVPSQISLSNSLPSQIIIALVFFYFYRCLPFLSCSQFDGILFYYKENENNQKRISTSCCSHIQQPAYICTNINLGLLLWNWINVSSFYLKPPNYREHDFYSAPGLQD